VLFGGNKNINYEDKDQKKKKPQEEEEQEEEQWGNRGGKEKDLSLLP
jgi:hypothetical protein